MHPPKLETATGVCFGLADPPPFVSVLFAIGRCSLSLSLLAVALSLSLSLLSLSLI